MGQAVADFLANSDLTTLEVILLIVVLLGMWRIDKNHKRELKYRQDEINRLARDNRDYRDRFERILNAKLGRMQSDTEREASEGAK